MMKFFYLTLSNADQAKQISIELIEKHIAACTNYWPMQSVYRWQGEIRVDSEVVLIIKTKSHQRQAIEAVIRRHIDYTNCIAEIDVSSVNESYLQWLNREVDAAR